MWFINCFQLPKHVKIKIDQTIEIFVNNYFGDENKRIGKPLLAREQYVIPKERSDLPLGGRKT